MNAQAEEVTSVADIVKLVICPVLITAGVVAFYHFSDLMLLYRVLGLVIIVALSVGICFTTARGRAVWQFIGESKQEMRRVVWPTKDETVRTTLLVFTMVFVVGLILWLLDMFLFWAVQLLMNQGMQ
ncbi:preprotein translocase subunit SecE [Methylomonas rapida]|jgi:preprotein translocase, SecE subunit, bacterial|uniref:Protein translocase subunit SecE n=1 Tax=Methylomonas rapida TaxID=2963939 RepID=A0ABY7GH90_9GAMM|nr:preprotein translocase subunit SecE [Methylomonas rapida]WAR44327.1 preprotein translocase subunit SecE [Methylomonas rapida]